MEPWRELVAEGKLWEASVLLAPEATGMEGMGFYAAVGYSAEARGDEAVAAGNVDSGRVFYEDALRSYLMYAQYPARGDSEDYGIGLAEDVLKKIARM